MNFIQNYNVNVNLPNTAMTNYENFSGSASSVYDEVSPQQQNSTPISNDSFSEKHNQSTISSKKSEVSVNSTEDTAEITVENLERTLTEEKLAKIDNIISMISSLDDNGKLMVQLKFPMSDDGNCDDDNFDLGSGFDSAGNQKEHNEAITWVTTHLEEDNTTCLKKQEVYFDYKSFCQNHNVKYLSTADFGKVMKRAFPNVKARRLGARGKSQYCYSGLKNRNKITSPKLTDIGLNCDMNLKGIGHDKGNDGDSVSSNSSPPDLSNIPEYELSHSILIDSALVIIDYFKRANVTNTKDISSLKEMVEHLLANNLVDMHSSHALRLCSLFQIDSQRSKKKYLVDQVLKTIKKEESNSNPGSVQYQSNSPQNHLKRSKMPLVSPIPEKAASYYDHSKMSHTVPINTVHNNPHCQPHINTGGFNYGVANNSCQQYYGGHLPMINNNNAVTHNNNNNIVVPHSAQNMMPVMSPINCQRPFLPNSYSTPTKDPTLKLLGPSLNSPLLENSPATTKRLELSTALKQQSMQPIPVPNSAQHNYPHSVHHPHNHQHWAMATVPDNSRLHYESPSMVQPAVAMVTQKQISYHDRDIESPIPMTGRRYGNDEDDCDEDDFDTNFDTNFDNYGTNQSPKRRIVADYNIDFNACATPNHFIVDGDYGNPSFISAANRQQSGEDNPYLETPGNSPTNRSSNQEHSEDSRNNTPHNFSGHFSALKEQLLSASKTTPTANHHQRSQYMLAYGANDEYSVTSTTNTGALDNDRRPSTTVPFHFNI